jgi:DHA1 family tetracycline resistance protein-like MFS transporter
MKPAPSRTPALGFIFITLLLDVLGFGLLIPVAPKLIQSLMGVGESKDGIAAAAQTFGWLVSTYAAMQLVFSPILGALSDRFGRRPLLLISTFGSGLDYFAMALSPNLAFLFVTRALNGISGASMTVCSAYVADVTPPEKRAAAFGLIGAAFGIGFVVGPLLGGLLGSIDMHLPFYVAGGLALSNWLYGYFVLPESLPRERRASFSLAKANPIGALVGLGRYPVVAGMTAGLFLMNLAMFGLHATWVNYTMYRYGWESWQVGLSLSVVGIGAAIVQGGLARKIIPALGPGVVGERRALLIGVAIGVLAYIGYGLAPEGWMIYAIVSVASFGGIAQPAFQSIVTKTVHRDEQGLIQGAMGSLQSAAQILGPIIATAAFAYGVSKDTAPPLNLPGLSFFVGALLSGMGLLVAVWATRSLRSTAQTQA